MLRLILYECKISFFKKSILTALFIFSIINIIKINSVYEQKSLFADKSKENWSSVYWELYKNYSGEITKEKIAGLLEIFRPLERQTADLTASTSQNNPDTLTGNVYSDFYLLNWMYVSPMEYNYMYQSTADNICLNALENIKFFKSFNNKYECRKNETIYRLFSDRKISGFAYTEMYQYYIYYDFSLLLILLLVLYGIVNVFVTEKETEMNCILLTTQSGGKKTVTAKLISSVLFIFSISLWFLILDFLCFGFFFGSFEGSSLPVYTIQSFVGYSVTVTLLQYALLSGCYKFTGILFFSLLFLFISSFFRNALQPFILNLLLCFSFIIIGERFMGSGYVLSKVINPFMLLINRELLVKQSF